MVVHADWIVPAWPVPSSVRAVCTTRAGGVSGPPYASLNLGAHVGDSPEAVELNRAAFADAIGVKPVFLQQVHGTDVTRLAGETAQGRQADGCYTTEAGLACTILVADCLPVLFATRDGRAVAAAHAGWRGMAGAQGRGVLESLWSAFSAETGATAGETAVWLGPCIGPKAFEVGPDVKAAFESVDPGATHMFRPCREGKWLADLPGLARRRLQALGLADIHGNDGAETWCTVAQPSRFFSHRRDGISGRFAAAIWRT